MAITRNPQIVNGGWVAQAAARAEARSRTKWSKEGFQADQHTNTPLSQLQRLIGAVMDDRVTRRELRQIALSISEGRS